MVPAVFIQKSTKQIIKHALYPRQDMAPIEDLDPDYEWLIQNIPFPEPDYDPRIYIMVTNLPDLTHLDDFLEHPTYPGLREYRITYSPEKRPKADIIRSIENAEKEANNSIFSEAAHKDQLVFMMNSVYKAAQGSELTPDEELQVVKLNTINMKMSKNADNKNILVAQVNANQEPNIDAGWEKNQ